MQLLIKTNSTNSHETQRWIKFAGYHLWPYFWTNFDFQFLKVYVRSKAYITYIQGSESSFIIALQLLYSDFITSF